MLLCQFFHVNSQAKEVWPFVNGDRNNVSRTTVLALRVLGLLSELFMNAFLTLYVHMYFKLDL